MRRVLPALLAIVALIAILIALALPSGLATPLAGGAGVRVEQVDAARYPELTLFVSVHDTAGNPQAGLGRDDFRVIEDGVPVELADFGGAGEGGPISAAMVIDRSGSMEDDDKIDGARQAAAAFVDLMRPGDQAALIVFNESVLTWEAFTTDKVELHREIQQIEAKDGTALYDAIVAGVDLLRDQPGRRVLVVLSDGEDTHSDNSLDEALAYAEEAGQPVYVVGLGDGSNIDEPVLEQIATETGGQYFYAPEADELAALYAGLAGNIQQEYRLIYVSPRPTYDGTRRDIQVIVGGATASTGYTERHLINVESAALSGLALLVPLLGLLFLPAALRARRAPLVPVTPVAPTMPAPVPAIATAPATIIEAPTPVPVAAPEPGARRCVSCNSSLRPGARFCNRCGTAQPAAAAPAAERRIFCDMCGRPMLAGAQFCTECGEPARTL